MKCSNPDCNRGIGLVAYQRGWFSKRRNNATRTSIGRTRSELARPLNKMA